MKTFVPKWILRGFVLFLGLILGAKADLPADFAEMTRQSKGPFGINVLQSNTERVSVSEGRIPNPFLFQAAYRNAAASVLVSNHRFYVGNLFATNYYELMGEFVFGDPASNHPLDHEEMEMRAETAIGKAASIVRHWVLEKFYVERFPQSKLARSFRIRGVSSAEHELEYAKYFFGFYLVGIREDFQYLPAFLLVTQSPVIDAASLARARTLVAVAYEEISLAVGATDPMARALYLIRNGIHNQLDRGLITEIDAFLEKFPHYRSTPAGTQRTDMDEIRAILADYFALESDKIAALAKQVGLTDLRKAADRITRNGATPENLRDLSSAAVDARLRLSDSKSTPFSKRAEAFSVLATTTRYLKKKIMENGRRQDRALAVSAIDAVFVEGFLIRDNWKYFREEVARAPRPATVLRDVLDVAGNDTLAEAFRPALAQWISVDRRMNGFADQVIKSSALEAVANLAGTASSRNFYSREALP